MHMQRPITELHHPFASTLDGSLEPEAFLRVLRSTDAQIFGGYDAFECLLDASFVSKLARAATCAGRILHHGGSVVMTGCGTSGRLGFLTARRFGNSGATLRYCHAGGDAALLLSDELPEDDALLGAQEMMAAVPVGATAAAPCNVFLIGVSCGISAPYVGGQVGQVLERVSLAPGGLMGVALIGFNPTTRIKDTEVPNLYGQDLPGSMQALSCRLEAQYQATQDPSKASCFLLNPVVGPEPIAGSSRMKGGSATLVLLDVLCASALQSNGNVPVDEADVMSQLLVFQSVHAATYAAAQKGGCLAHVMRRCADGIHAGGHVYYLGTQSAGIMGCIDLSEMPDTYGAPFDQMRGFVVGGWATFGNRAGDIGEQSPLLRCSLDDFVQDVQPHLGPNDTVLLLVDPAETRLREAEALAAVVSNIASSSAGCYLAMLAVLRGTEPLPHCQSQFKAMLPCCASHVLVQLPASASTAHSDFAVKLMVNAVSTYAQAAGRGAVFKGTMIATGPANEKIYQRCVDMVVETVPGATPHTAEIALIRSVYGMDDAAEAEPLVKKPRHEHIKRALVPANLRHLPQMVLPVAFLLAMPPTLRHPIGWRVEEARRAVVEQPLIYRLVATALEEVREPRPSAGPPAVGSGATAALADVVIGVDLGGTNLRCGVVSDTGKLLYVQSCSLGSDRSIAAVMSRIVLEVTAAILWTTSQAGRGYRLVAVGVGQPGYVAADGSISKLAAFDWGGSSAPVRASLLACVPPGIDVFVFDDAASALAGELAFGSARLAETVVMFTVGTGIGSAVAMRGGSVIHRGGRGLIELGHSLLWEPELWTSSSRTENANAPICPCGQRGCVETVASGSAIAACRLPEGEALDAASHGLAVCILNAVRAYDPDVVVLGGGLGVTMLPLVRRHFRRLQWSLHDDAAEVPFSLAACPQPGVQGAAALALRSIQQKCSGLPRLGGLPHTPPSRFQLRRATPFDMDAMYNVCLKTGDGGADGTHLFSDPRLLGSIFVGPYVVHAPTFAFVLVDTHVDEGDEVAMVGGGVCGYVLGVLDTNAFQAACRTTWRLQQRDQYPVGALSSYRPLEQELIQELIHAPDVVLDAPRADWRLYPSHMHIDMLPHAQGQGLGTVMVSRLLDALRGAGSTGIHLGMAPTNDRAFQFYKKLGFHKIDAPEQREWILAMSL